MKILLTLTLSLGFSISTTGQPKIDSLKAEGRKLAESKDDERKAYIIWSIGNEFSTQAQYDSALDYFQRVLTYYTNDPTNLAATFNSMGIAYNYKGSMDSSALYYQKALLIYQQVHDTTNAVIAGINLAIIYKNRGWYDKALESAFDALSRQELKPADRTLASIYNTIGSVYTLIEDYPKALEYYRKSLVVRTRIGHTSGIGQSYTNIGEVYLHLHLYDSALNNLFLSEKIKRQGNDRSILGSSLNLIGEVYLKMNDFSKAEPYFLEAREIKRTAGEKLKEASVLNNLGQLKLKSKDFRAAEKFLNEAEDIIRSSNSLNDLRINLEQKVQLYKAWGNDRSAFRFAEELIAVNDSLLNEEKAESLIALQMQYETEKKEQQIQLLENNKRIQDIEIRSKKFWINGLVIFVIVILGAIVIIYYQYRQVRINKNKAELLLKEVHHRVKNNLQILSSLFSLQAANLTDGEAIQAIKGSESRVNAMAIIHKKLYGDNVSRSINMREYLSELLEYLTYSYNYGQRNGELNLYCESISIDVDKAIPLGLIINELASNAMKYAYDGQPSPRLTLQLHKSEKSLEIEISDNGSGLNAPMHELSTKSFGLKLVNTLVKELKGTLKTQNHNGTTFQIIIPTT